MQASSFTQDNRLILKAFQAIIIKIVKHQYCNICIFVLSAYISGLCGIFEFYTYIFEISHLLVRKCTKNIEAGTLLIMIFTMCFLYCMNNQRHSE